MQATGIIIDDPAPSRTYRFIDLHNGEGRVYFHRDHVLDMHWPPSGTVRFEIVEVEFDGKKCRQARNVRYERKPHGATCAVGLFHNPSFQDAHEESNEQNSAPPMVARTIRRA
jgi:hypothetical protein